MTICNDLREAVLQAAMQGKLTKQRQTDSSAKGLVEKIIEQRKTAGRIKSTEPIVFENIDIPENWSAIRCGNCLGLFDGEKVSGINLPYLEAKYLRGKISATMKRSGEMVKQGAKIILVDGENSGEVFSVPEDGILGSTFKVLFIPESINEKFVMYFLEMHRDMLKNNKKGAAIPHLNKEVFNSLIIPVPPIEEQQRIVAIVDNLMAKIDDLEKTENELETLKKDFPGDMKASILQAAMQGKLTEQRQTDSPAKGLLEKIIEQRKTAGGIKSTEPIVFEDMDIPENWSAIRCGNCLGLFDGEKVSGINLPYLEAKYLRGKISATMKQNGKMVKQGVKIILVDGENSGEVFSAPEDGILGSTFKVLFIPESINEKFVMYFLEMHREMLKNNKKGAAIPHLNKEVFNSLIIPVPPIEEQQRIINKLDQLLPLCDILQEGME